MRLLYQETKQTRSSDKAKSQGKEDKIKRQDQGTIPRNQAKRQYRVIQRQYQKSISKNKTKKLHQDSKQIKTLNKIRQKTRSKEKIKRLYQEPSPI